jgi:hypothetical protein
MLRSRPAATLKAFRAMTFSDAHHFKECIAVPTAVGARLGKLPMSRFSDTASYRCLRSWKAGFPDRSTPIEDTQLIEIATFQEVHKTPMCDARAGGQHALRPVHEYFN